MNEHELFGKMRNDAEQINIPVALEPEQITEKLSSVNRKRKAPAVVAVAVSFLIVCTSVFYGYMLINTGEQYQVKRAVTVAKTQKQLEMVYQPKSYSEIYNLLKDRQKEDNAGWYLGQEILESAQNAIDSNSLVSKSAAADSSTSGSAAPSSDSGVTQYSDTNVQVEGVQEADVVKTDGEYIYTINNTSLYIYKVKDGEVNKLSETVLSENTSFMASECYLTQDKLTIIAHHNDDTAYNEHRSYVSYYANTSAIVIVYDISDRENPQELSRLNQSGTYVTGRMIDQTLYLITNYYASSVADEDIQHAENYVPTAGSIESPAPMNVEDICIIEQPQSESYIIVSSLNIDNPQEFLQTKSLLGASGSNIYCSLSRLYIGSENYSSDNSTTDFFVYSLNEGQIELTAEAKIDGYLHNQFSMDEYNGYFRVVTSQWVEVTEEIEEYDSELINIMDTQYVHRLYVLNGELEQVGVVEKNTGNEQLKSVRFDGDLAYFVTFMQTDPLFAVDLTNPEDPQVTTELKIPGFSTYMHSYGENRLLGFGQNAKDDGVTNGLKLSMFDTSDKYNVGEKHVIKFGTQNTGSVALQDHKAILIAPEKNLIGIPVYEYSYDDDFYQENYYYYMFSYDDSAGFKQIGKFEMYMEEDNFYSDRMRGLYVDDYIYLINAPTVEAHSLDGIFSSSGE